MKNNNHFLTNSLLNIYERPSKKSSISSQIIFGEKFIILSKNKGWLKIKTAYDNYKGYIRNPQFIKKFEPTHKIFKLKAKIYKKNKKNKFSPTKNYLTFSSQINISKKEKSFGEYNKNKWIKLADTKIISHIEKSFFKIFKIFLNTKYIWGGKSYKGLDCSALVQLFFLYNRKFYPRDTKDQIKYSPKNSKNQKFSKGNIIFWKGHIAVCISNKELIHAYGPEKKVIIMPINKTIERIKRTAGLEVKKLSSIKI